MFYFYKSESMWNNYGVSLIISLCNDGLSITMLSSSILWHSPAEKILVLLLASCLWVEKSKRSVVSSPFALKFGIQDKPLMKCICIWIMFTPEPIPGLFQKLFMCDVSSCSVCSNSEALFRKMTSSLAEWD